MKTTLSKLHLQWTSSTIHFKWSLSPLIKPETCIISLKPSSKTVFPFLYKYLRGSYILRNMGTKSWKQGILHSKTEWWVLEKGLGMLVTSNVSECSLWRTEVPPNGDTGGTSQARPPRALVYNCSHSCGKGATFVSERYNSTQTLSPLRCQGLKNTRTSTLHFTTKDLPLSVNCKRESWSESQRQELSCLRPVCYDHASENMRGSNLTRFLLQG